MTTGQLWSGSTGYTNAGGIAPASAPAMMRRHIARAPRHAHQLCRLPERPQARRYPDRGHQRVREPARLLRLGRDVRAHAGRTRRNGRGVRPARAGRRRCATRPPAAEDRGIRRFAVRGAAYRRAGEDARRRRGAPVGRGRHLRRPQLRPLGAPAHADGLRRRARARRARARIAAARLGLRVLRADGQRGRPLLSRSSTAWKPSSRRSRSRSSCATRRARTSSRCTR